MFSESENFLNPNNLCGILDFLKTSKVALHDLTVNIIAYHKLQYLHNHLNELEICKRLKLYITDGVKQEMVDVIASLRKKRLRIGQSNDFHALHLN